MTNLSAICPFLPFTFFFIKWTHSKAIVVLFVIILFGTKAQWVSSIVWGKICLTLLATVFVRILKIRLQRLIGLNSLGWDGFFYLGDQSNNSLVEMWGILPIIQNTKKKTHHILSVATYPSTGGRGERKVCVFQKRERTGVSINVYSRKTLEKPKMRSANFENKGSGVVYA